jgi:hypothetical protein
VNEECVFLEDECSDIAPDARAGEWPVALVEQWRELAADCTKRYASRVCTMSTVLQRLTALHGEFDAAPSEREAQLLLQTAALRRELAAARLTADVQAHRGVQASFDCVCCVETFPLSRGVMCSRADLDPAQAAHFLCGGAEGCFDRLVQSQATDTGCFRKNGCRIVCSQCKAMQPAVQSPYPDMGMACSDAAFAIYLAAREAAARHLESCLAEQQRQEERARHEDEVHALREQVLTDQRERASAACERHRKRIIETVLNIGCPHCGLVFEAFNGCYAVDHIGLDERGLPTALANSYCSRSFCGWCLAKFNDSHSCHEHVKVCPHSLHPGSYYGTFPEDFDHVHGANRKRRVQTYIAEKVEAGHQDAVREAIRRDLADLSIVL